MSKSRKSRFRRHFKWRLHFRFHLKSQIVQEVEAILMQRLFINKLHILKETEDTVKIWYPELHKKCILIFDKKENVFVTAYKKRKLKIEKNG